MSQIRPAVYDGHCHVASTDLIPRQFVEDVTSAVHTRLEAEGNTTPMSRLIDAFEAQHQDHLADRLVGEMDAAGVDRALLLAPDLGLRMATPLSIEDIALRHHEIRLRHPGRFWVFVGADPRRGDGLASFEKSVVQYGFEGLKLYPPCGYSPSDPRLYPYYEICAARGLVVFVHTGPTVRSLDFEPAHPMLIDQAARDFPGVNFILGHGAIAYLEVAAGLALHRPNIYLDTGGFAGAALLGGWQHHLNQVFRLAISDKIVFGTDWPLNRMSGGLKRLISAVVDGEEVFAGVRRRDRERILSGNLSRLLPTEDRAESLAPR